MYQHLSETQKTRLYNAVLATFVLLAIFLAVKTITAFNGEEGHGENGNYTQNMISVTGKGEVIAIPDTTVFSLSIVEEGKTVAKAQDKAAKKENAILAAIKEMGVADKDVKTENYNSYPKYDYTAGTLCTNGYCPPGKQVISGYEVTESITVKVRKIGDAGSIITKIGTLGAANISAPSSVVDNMDAINAEARDAAIQDAKAKAAVLGRSLGIRLHKIVNFQEGGNPYPVVYAGGMMKADAMSSEAAPAVPQLPTGENKVVSNVTITYEVE